MLNADHSTNRQPKAFHKEMDVIACPNPTANSPVSIKQMVFVLWMPPFVPASPLLAGLVCTLSPLVQRLSNRLTDIVRLYQFHPLQPGNRAEIRRLAPCRNDTAVKAQPMCFQNTLL